MFLLRPELVWQLRITYLVRVKIGNIDPHTVLHFTTAKLMQKRPPALVRVQVVGNMLGEQDVSGISAIHHSLRHVDSSTRDIHSVGHVHHPADWSAVNTDPNLQVRMSFERATNLDGTLRGFLRALIEDQRHSV